MVNASLAKLAVPAVVLLIALLSYTSQYLFYIIEPGPLNSRQTKIFNLLVICLWISYARACTTSPGSVPKNWSPDSNAEDEPSSEGKVQTRQRYCRKCDALKPPRSHHCKICKRYVGRNARFRRQRLTLPGEDAFPRWTITVLGLIIVYLTLHFPISCAFCGMPYPQ